MGEMFNKKCKTCPARTKLLIKKDDGKLAYWCSVAKDCPHSNNLKGGTETNATRI